MRFVLALFFLLNTLSAFAQLDCYFEDHNHQVTSQIQTLSNAMANCSVVSADKYWMCRALTERNCSLLGARNERDFWFCQALTMRNCPLARNQADYWYCRGITDKNCTVSGTDKYWSCRAVTEDNCSLAPASEYWFCRALGSAFH